MSYTPRMDAAYFSKATFYDLVGEIKKLERELTAAREIASKYEDRYFSTQAELTAAQAEITRLRAGGCASDQRTTQFCGESLKLQEENARLQERVKRLEEALDTLTLVVELTPIAGNKEALQEAVDIARSELKAKDNP